jgi:hypothetical protein
MNKKKLKPSTIAFIEAFKQAKEMSNGQAFSFQFKEGSIKKFTTYPSSPKNTKNNEEKSRKRTRNLSASSCSSSETHSPSTTHLYPIQYDNRNGSHDDTYRSMELDQDVHTP